MSAIAQAQAPVPDTSRLQGGDLRAYAPGQITLDLSVCGNVLGPSPSAIRAGMRLLARHPQSLAPPPYGCELPYLEAFADRLRVDAGELLAGRGVTEFLVILARLLKRRRPAVIVPDYTETLHLFDYATFYAPRDPATDSAADRLARVHQAMANHDHVILSNPCNPTGHALPAPDLLAICREFPDSVLIVDEEYAGLYGPGLSLAGSTANVAVLQSTGKTYGMVGTRAGVLWTRHTGLRDLVQGQLISWPLSALDAAMATAALRDPAWLITARTTIHHNADLLQTLLVRTFGPRVQQQQRLHYRFVHLPDSRSVAEHLARHRIAVRTFDGHGHSIPGIRITAPATKSQLTQLSHALDLLPPLSH